MVVPKSWDLYNPTLQALKRLGGSASIAELDEEVIKLLKLSAGDIAQPHDARQTEIEYQLAWARTYLKKFGLIDNSERGIWVFTPRGREVQVVVPREVRQYVGRQKLNKQKRTDLDI